MADNNTQGTESREQQDEQLARARKSMGNRVDPDPTDDTPADTTPPKKEEEKPANEKKDQPSNDDPAGEDPEKKPEDDGVATDDEEPEDKKPDAYHIPVKKYTDEKKEWHTKVEEKDREIATLKEQLAKKSEDPKVVDQEIKAFADAYGIDEDGIGKLTTIIGSKLLPAEQRKALDALIVESQARSESALFNEEFTRFGEPELKEMFGEIEAEKMPAIKALLDAKAHTQAFHDKELPYIIFKNKGEIQKILKPEVTTTGEDKPKTRGMETTRIGNGRPQTINAAYFKDKTDFSELANLDEAERTAIIKDMDVKTYQKMVQYAQQNAGGLEVMRNGRKINLK